MTRLARILAALGLRRALAAARAAYAFEVELRSMNRALRAEFKAERPLRQPYAPPRLTHGLCPQALVNERAQAARVAEAVRTVKVLHGLGQRFDLPCRCATHRLAGELRADLTGTVLRGSARVH